MDLTPVLKTAESLEAYHEMIRQALFEVDDLRAALEYDAEDTDMGAAWKFIDGLEQDLRSLAAEVADGSHRFEDRDLPFMAVVMRQPRHVLPFRNLLRLINDTHRKGLGQQLDIH